MLLCQNFEFRLSFFEVVVILSTGFGGFLESGLDKLKVRLSFVEESRKHLFLLRNFSIVLLELVKLDVGGP